MRLRIYAVCEAQYICTLYKWYLFVGWLVLFCNKVTCTWVGGASIIGNWCRNEEIGSVDKARCKASENK